MKKGVNLVYLLTEVRIPPDDRGQLLDPAPGGALEWYLESRLQSVEDALVGPFCLAVGFRVGDRREVEPDVVLFAEFIHGSFGEVGAIVRDDAAWEPIVIYELA